MNIIPHWKYLVFLAIPAIVGSYGSMFAIEILNVDPYNPAILITILLSTICYGGLFGLLIVRWMFGHIRR